MGVFRNVTSGVVVTVDDRKDGRYTDGQWAPLKPTAKKAPAKKAPGSTKK